MNVSDPTGLLAKDPELQHFIESQEQLVRLEKQVHKLTEECWDKCVTNVNVSRLDSKTETCLAHCVERFIDASTFIVQNFGSKLDSASSASNTSQFGNSSEMLTLDDNSFNTSKPMREEEPQQQSAKSSFKFW